jgi:hypothetical protein
MRRDGQKLLTGSYAARTRCSPAWLGRAAESAFARRLFVISSRGNTPGRQQFSAAARATTPPPVTLLYLLLSIKVWELSALTLCGLRLTFDSGLQEEGSFVQLTDRRCTLMRVPIPAIRAVQNMVEAPDFDRKMLLLATQLANESDMKSLLLVVLEALLNSIQSKDEQKLRLETLTLIRCIIRLTVKLIAEPGAKRWVGPSW